MARSLSELAHLVEMIPSVKISGSVECKFISNYSVEPKNLFDNIQSIAFSYDIDSNEPYNIGFVPDGNWKNLEDLCIYEKFTFTPLLIMDDFSRKTWHFYLPNLTRISIWLNQIPFPYCSLVSLLLNSTNLSNLRIKLRKSIIQEFDVDDFKQQLENKELNLKEVSFENKKFPIIPFESLLDLLEASPKIERVTANLCSVDEQFLISKYYLEMSEEFCLKDFPYFIRNMNDTSDTCSKSKKFSRKSFIKPKSMLRKMFFSLFDVL